MLTIDCRCGHSTCRDKNIYRMVGACSNCGTKNVLMLFTATHDSYMPQCCPVCGCAKVHAQRLATADEIPAAAQKEQGNG